MANAVEYFLGDEEVMLCGTMTESPDSRGEAPNFGSRFGSGARSSHPRSVTIFSKQTLFTAVRGTSSQVIIDLQRLYVSNCQDHRIVTLDVEVGAQHA